MSTLTIRLPDDTAQRLKNLAHTWGLSINKLMEEPAPRPLLPLMRKPAAPWPPVAMPRRRWRFWIGWTSKTQTPPTEPRFAMALHQEIAFETDICNHSAQHGWLYGAPGAEATPAATTPPAPCTPPTC